MSLVSVVIPCYNSAAFLRETLESVFDQSYKDIEVVAVDDGSTDETHGILASYDSRIRTFFLEHQGASGARNEGTRRARGLFIQYLDSDDLLTKNAVSDRLVAMRNENADVAYSAWQKIVEDSSGNYIKGEIVDRSWESVHPDPEIAAFTDFWVPPAAILYTRSIIETIGEWKPNLPVIQDARFLFDAARSRARFVRVPGVGAYYRVARNKTSLSTRDSAAFLKDIFTNAMEIEAAWKAEGGIGDERKKALLKVYGYLARSGYGKDPVFFERVLDRILSIEPRYAPESPAHMKWASRMFGYPTAEKIALYWRRLKSNVSGEKAGRG